MRKVTDVCGGEKLGGADCSGRSRVYRAAAAGRRNIYRHMRSVALARSACVEHLGFTSWSSMPGAEKVMLQGPAS